MPTLTKEQRNQLSRTVLAARDAAEEGARKALHTLGVDEADPPGHLSIELRQFRRALRAQARQLGDVALPNGTHEVRHLAEKIAYDHWHRLLFARFLAENNLLISPDHGVPVSLQDCAELAEEENRERAAGSRRLDQWDLATRFVAVLLPDAFRSDDPAGQLDFAPEDRTALQTLVTGMPAAIFLADDALGWTYQFWQEKRKEAVNKSGKKIGADELAPVTQLFTEDYMVLFLLHNTLGAWWAGRCAAVNSDQFSVVSCPTEEDARAKVALPGVNWEYLRFIRSDAAEGGHAAAPPSPPSEGGEGRGEVGAVNSEFRIPNSEIEWLPAAGTFTGWPRTAKELRILDPCMGSGHFVVAELPILVAMRMAEEGLSLPDAVLAVLRDNLFGLEIDLRCTQIAAFNLALAAWKLGGYQKLPPLNLACCGLGINAAEKDWLKLASQDERLRGGMQRLYRLFQQAPVLGSLINPRDLDSDLLTADFHELQPLLTKALAGEEAGRDDNTREMGVTAQGLVHAAEILARQFTLVATNVPYLGRGKQDNVLKEYCERVHTAAKADLATCFVERCLHFCASAGTAAMVAPQNWLFLDTFKRWRADLLRHITWNVVVKLGPAAFEDMNWWAANTGLFVLSASRAEANNRIAGFDVSAPRDPKEKAELLKLHQCVLPAQNGQLSNPDARILFEETSGQTLLSDFAGSQQGITTGDRKRFGCCFWELSDFTDWKFWQSTTEQTVPFSGREHILRWTGSDCTLGDVEGATLRGSATWGKRGVLVSLMGGLSATLSCGEVSDDNTTRVLPHLPEEHLAAVWSFCSSQDFSQEVRQVDQAVKVMPLTVLQVPFELKRWQKVAAEKYPNGLPKPHSDDPTQWLFYGHPNPAHPHGMINRPPLAISNSQLSTPHSPLQVAVARLLGYRWPRQTGSSFPDCPALGPDGLEGHADADGIVCLNASKGEAPAAERLRGLLADAFGVEWSPARQAELLAQVEYAGKSLDDWLRNAFFEQHCQRFHQRPFVWHIWDALKNGFSALVNYHRLDRANLEKLTYTYLGDWIVRQKAAVDAGEDGSDARLAAARDLQEKLKRILEGEPPYDIFIRWKGLAAQPIGWGPDLNDGVRLNIRPFVVAGVLRKNPKINWNKDRGTDVSNAPWYPVFKGERINDHHLTLAEKRKAREAVPEIAR